MLGDAAKFFETQIEFKKRKRSNPTQVGDERLQEQESMIEFFEAD